MFAHNRIVARISLGLILLNPLTMAFATEIHKWVDQDGITHYSEDLPADVEVAAEKLELPDAYTTPPRQSDDGYYSVINQATRLEASRLAREEDLRKDRQQDLQELALESQQTPEVVDTQQDDRYYPVFFHNNRVRQFDNRYDFHGRYGQGRHGRYFDDNTYAGKSRRNSRPGSASRRDSPAFKSSTFQRQ